MCLFSYSWHCTLGEKKNVQVGVYSVPFNESLNMVLQENQMEIQVCFWSEKLKKALTLYLGSEFQLCRDAGTLSDSLMKGLAALPIEKQHQLAMDGPEVNWKILRLIMDSRHKGEYPPLQDIGCCGLHVLRGALYTGVVANSWPIEKVLGAIFKFLHNYPARRAEYLRVSSSGFYPEKFCTT